MLRFVLFAVALLSPSVAGAAVGVLPVDATAMGADEARMRIIVTDVVKDVLRGRFRGLSVADDLQGRAVADCSAEPACLQALISRTGVDEVAQIAIERTGERDPWAKVTLQIFDASGARTFVVTQLLTTTRTNDLKGLLVQGFEPARYLARLEFVDLAVGDQLQVDRLLAAPTMTVRPGAHQVRVTHADGTLTLFDVDVAFDERKVIAVPQRDGGVAVVPAIVGGASVAAGAAGVVVGLMGYAFYDSALQRLDTSETTARIDKTRADLSGRRSLSMAGAVGGAVVAAAGVVVVVAAVLPALFPPTAEEER